MGGRKPSKSQERLILAFEGISRQLPDLIRDANTARFLNGLCHTTVFTPWNVGELPQIDIDELDQWQEMLVKRMEFKKEHNG